MTRLFGDRHGFLRGLMAATVMLLAGCGGGSSGGDIPTPAEPPYDEQPAEVQGSAVKGPIINGQATIHFLDPAASDLKGALVDSGTTSASAVFTDLVVPAETIRLTSAFTNRLFLVEVVGGQELVTNQAPILSTQRVIVTGSELIDGTPIYATPLTTFTIEMARFSYEAILDSDATLSPDDAFLRAFRNAQEPVKTAFGFGVLRDGDDIDLRLNSPIGASQSVLNHRTAIEGLAAIVDNIRQAASSQGNALDNDTLLAMLAEDLGDGLIDGQGAAGPLPALAQLETASLLRAEIERDPYTLVVPGTGRTLDQVNQLLVDEMAMLAPGEPAPLPTAPALVPATGASGDTDADGVPDLLDAFYLNSRESRDTDGDCGVIDYADQTPISGRGCGDNSDYAPADVLVQSICDTANATPQLCDDSDSDGVRNVDDLFPNNPMQAYDTNGYCESIRGYQPSDYLTASAGDDCGDEGQQNICYDVVYNQTITGTAFGYGGPANTTATLNTVEGIIRVATFRPTLEAFIGNEQTGIELVARSAVDSTYVIDTNSPDLAGSTIEYAHCTNLPADIPFNAGCAFLIPSVAGPKPLVVPPNKSATLTGTLLQRAVSTYELNTGATTTVDLEMSADPDLGARPAYWSCDLPYNP